jgi:hypothetical protein
MSSTVNRAPAARKSGRYRIYATLCWAALLLLACAPQVSAATTFGDRPAFVSATDAGVAASFPYASGPVGSPYTVGSLTFTPGPGNSG